MSQGNENSFAGAPLRFRRGIGILLLLWTVAVGLTLGWEANDEYVHARNLLHRGENGVELDANAIASMRSVNIRDRILGYGGMWFAGLVGITLFAKHLSQQISRRNEAEIKLQEAHDRLEERVAQRTAELADVNKRLEDEIEERRKAEEWLLESESRFRGYFEQGLVGMAMLSAKKDWIEVNERLCRTLGYSEEELVLLSWDQLTHPDDLPAENAKFQALLDGESSRFILTKRFLRKGGAAIPVEISAQCMRNSEFEIDSVFIVVQETQNRA